MGRMLGAFDEDESFDRPELNKCPDCACFFAQDACPVCGKVCPEEMRAGKRKPVKAKKRKRRSGSDRVVFVEWYYSWWFLLLMLFFMPIVGIVLLIKSPHGKGFKIAFAALLVIYTVGIGNIVGFAVDLWDTISENATTREDYVESCENLSPGRFYRAAASYEDKRVCMTLVVVEKKIAQGDFYDDTGVYYRCTTEEGTYEILIHDDQRGDGINLMPNDVVIVYGEGEGNVTIYLPEDDYEPYTAPCVAAKYLELLE